MVWFQSFNSLFAQCSTEAWDRDKASECVPMALHRYASTDVVNIDMSKFATAAPVLEENPTASSEGRRCGGVLTVDENETLNPSWVRGERGIDVKESLKVPAFCGESWGDIFATDAAWSRPRFNDDMVLDRAIRSFTESMQYGVQVEVVMDDGQVMEVQLSLDFEASRLILRLRDVEREIPLDDILRVCSPGDTAGEPAVTNNAHVTECCTTLILSSTHFLTFSFETERQREYFETCLRGLVAARRQRVREPLAEKQLQAGQN